MKNLLICTAAHLLNYLIENIQLMAELEKKSFKPLVAGYRIHYIQCHTASVTDPYKKFRIKLY